MEFQSGLARADIPIDLIDENRARLIIWLLLLGGVGVTVLSCPLGQLCVTHAYSNNGSTWNVNEANQAATVLRCLGGMAFAAGLVERLILALTAKGKSPN